MDIKVCIGSACYLKGAYEVIEIFNGLINKHGLQSKIELNASFCLGHCMNAVSVKRWDGKILSISKEDAHEKFEKYILAYL